MQALNELVEAAASEIEAAGDLAALDAVRVSYLGKKGELTARLKSLSQLPADERPAAGQEINKAKQEVQGRINARRETLESAALEEKLATDAVDVTLPGRGYYVGGRHPVSRSMARIESIFRNAGFGVRSGPEIEDDFHNFTALNFPPDHPARAMSAIGKSRRWLLGLPNRAWVTTAYRPKAHIALIWAKLSACDPEPTLLDSSRQARVRH
jgi:phenylalanyl-tRNA synthetase alpha chain